MADERDLELLDDYLTNRMSGGDRSAFEQRLQADPDLKHEYALQKRLIKAIKDARVSELKSMLNQVAVPANAPNTLATKIILGTVVSVIIASATYWYLTHDGLKLAQPKSPAEEQAPVEKPAAPEAKTDGRTQTQQPEENKNHRSEADKNQTSAGTEHSKPSLAKKPDPLEAPGEKSGDQTSAKEPVLDVFNPGSEEANNANNLSKDSQPIFNPGTPSLSVETDRENRRYTFHYQFREGKLFLYGPFEQNLYEIMEFFTGEKRTVFLYYRDRYYLLEEADSNVRPLTSITDPALIKKLKEYRTSK
jgi:hypothetical protein